MTSLSEVVTSVRLDPVAPADGTESVDGSNVSVESGTADAPPAPDPGTPPDPNAGTPDVVEVVASDSASAEDTHQ